MILNKINFRALKFLSSFLTLSVDCLFVVVYCGCFFIWTILDHILVLFCACLFLMITIFHITNWSNLMLFSGRETNGHTIGTDISLHEEEAKTQLLGGALPATSSRPRKQKPGLVRLLAQNFAVIFITLCLVIVILSAILFFCYPQIFHDGQGFPARESTNIKSHVREGTTSVRLITISCWQGINENFGCYFSDPNLEVCWLTSTYVTEQIFLGSPQRCHFFPIRRAFLHPSKKLQTFSSNCKIQDSSFTNQINELLKYSMLTLMYQ